jgi:hypothetical protein
VNLVSPTKPWPELDGEPLSLHDVVQRGMSEWHERTGGWPTDLILGSEAREFLIADAVKPECSAYFAGSTAEETRYCGLIACIGTQGTPGVRLARGLPEVQTLRQRIGRVVIPLETTTSIPLMNAIMDGVKQLGGQQSSDGGAYQFVLIHPDFDEVQWNGDKQDPSIPRYAATIGTGVSGITVTWRRVEQDVNGRN